MSPLPDNYAEALARERADPGSVEIVTNTQALLEVVRAERDAEANECTEIALRIGKEGSHPEFRRAIQRVVAEISNRISERAEKAL